MPAVTFDKGHACGAATTAQTTKGEDLTGANFTATATNSPENVIAEVCEHLRGGGDYKLAFKLAQLADGRIIQWDPKVVEAFEEGILKGCRSNPEFAREVTNDTATTNEFSFFASSWRRHPSDNFKTKATELATEWLKSAERMVEAMTLAKTFELPTETIRTTIENLVKNLIKDGDAHTAMKVVRATLVNKAEERSEPVSLELSTKDANTLRELLELGGNADDIANVLPATSIPKSRTIIQLFTTASDYTPDFSNDKTVHQQLVDLAKRNPNLAVDIAERTQVPLHLLEDILEPIANPSFTRLLRLGFIGTSADILPAQNALKRVQRSMGNTGRFKQRV